MNWFESFFPKFKIKSTFDYPIFRSRIAVPLKFGIKKRFLFVFYLWIRDKNYHWYYSPIGYKTCFNRRESAQAYINNELKKRHD